MIDSAPLETDPKVRYATERIDAFGRRFTQQHLTLAYHAAFPLALTPDLLYRLRDYPFQPKLQIPWIAVADLLLSGLCYEVGQELYEMDMTVRQVLLNRLTQEFGSKRLRELSTFLLDYIERQIHPSDTRLIQGQRWTALAYVEPKEAAKEITLKLTKLLQNDTSDCLQIAFLVETLAQPLKDAGFEPLLTLAKGMEQSARGDKLGAKAQFDKLRHQLGHPPTIADVPINIVSTKTFSFDVVTLNAQGEIINKKRHQAQYFTQDLGQGVTLEMVAIPGGTFLMGSPESEEGRYESESPQHEVTIPPFFMGKYPVTQAQWRAVANLSQVNRELDPNPSRFKGDNLPVEQVSWYDAVEFCDRLSKWTKRNYRLPSEAEWEYACRAGTTTSFHFGETITTEVANFYGKITYASAPEGKERKQTTPVGSFKVANRFGLFDMHGNVREWCYDNWHKSYAGGPNKGFYYNDNDNQKRLLRGGSWYDYPRYCRSACRDYYVPDVRGGDIGFRVVVSVAD
ncbi:MAG: formylglycine-generating enzyme family protein [Scytonema sp. PMC 1069.18]|nr:formylglycine-generating enzyme family protein [Scytonema sp. PMC 1069.18]MEC4880106.1 formylglycine-generating enzyme family protein [Scytonema sp. PMC 1070.18]